MNRRHFITLVGGAAALPAAASAEQSRPRPMRRIGILMNLGADDPQAQTRVASFLQGLQEAGWAVGRNVQIDIRWGDRDVERNRKNVGELVALTPDAILATTFPLIVALQRRPAKCRSFSRELSIQSARDWSRALPGRAVTPPDLPVSNTA